jgi:antitoxin (DNA-binding transcriptional repressor) of toxin-antitoxin stability system
MTPQLGAQDQINGDKPRIYTMRQLNQETATVIKEIGKNGPALITRLGRFVVKITPLDEEVESRVLSEMAREIGKRDPGSSAQVNDGKPDVYTVRQLGQKTAFVIEQIEKNGPALITRYGHFVAVITPLGGQVESRVLGEMAREIGKQRSAASPQEPALRLSSTGSHAAITSTTPSRLARIWHS